MLSENKNAKIIIVDDEKFLTESLGIYLKKLNYNVVVAESGEEGLSLIRKNKFDIGIIDYDLGDMDGYTFLLRAELITKELKYILISGKVNSWDEKEKVKVKNAVVLKKPFSLGDMAVSINKLKREKR